MSNVFVFNGNVFFANGTEVFCFDDTSSMDAAPEADGEPQAIDALWESGYMDFGADFRKKYSSEIYVSMLPEAHSEMTITAATDRRGEYMSKTVRNNILDWEKISFMHWSFDTNNTPKIKRIRLKVKKFVYYKLVFRVETAGARATVLGYDQQIRFGSMAK